MKSYNSIHIVATVFQVIAWLNLVTGILAIILLWEWWTNHPNGIYFVVALSFISVVYFIFFLAIAQSIMLMINIAKDVESIAKNHYISIEQSQTQRLQYEKQSLENQQKIIALLSSLHQGENLNPKSTTTMTSKNYHKIITALFRLYNPNKISEVIMLLDKNKGQEEALLQSLYSQYKVSLNDKIMFEQIE